MPTVVLVINPERMTAAIKNVNTQIIEVQLTTENQNIMFGIHSRPLLAHIVTCLCLARSSDCVGGLL